MEELLNKRYSNFYVDVFGHGMGLGQEKTKQFSKDENLVLWKVQPQSTLQPGRKKPTNYGAIDTVTGSPSVFSSLIL